MSRKANLDHVDYREERYAHLKQSYEATLAREHALAACLREILAHSGSAVRPRLKARALLAALGKAPADPVQRAVERQFGLDSGKEKG